MSDKLKALAQEACHALQFSLRYLEDALVSAKAKGAPEMVWKPLEEDVADHKELIADLEVASKLRSLHYKNLRLKAAFRDLEAQKPIAWWLEGTQTIETDYQPYHDGGEWIPLYAETTAAKLRVPTEEEAHQVGAVGAQATDEERLLFEAWMRGHCWALSAKWDGSGYRSEAEVNGDVDPWAMGTRRLWAAWRDRAALAKMDTL